MPVVTVVTILALSTRGVWVEVEHDISEEDTYHAGTSRLLRQPTVIDISFLCMGGPTFYVLIILVTV